MAINFLSGLYPKAYYTPYMIGTAIILLIILAYGFYLLGLVKQMEREYQERKNKKPLI